MLNNTLGILVTILLLFSACKDEEPSISSTKELLNFSILKSDNQGKVANDVEASIQGSVITLPLDKYDDLKSLIAVFEYNGKSITIDGVEQESGVTSMIIRSHWFLLWKQKMAVNSNIQWKLH